MAAFQLEIVSPEQLIFSSEVESVIVPGTEGEFTVLRDHAPLISSLKPGIITASETASKITRFFVPGGFAEVAPSGLTILANEAVDIENMNSGRFDGVMAKFEEQITESASEEERRVAVERRDQLRELRASLAL